MAKARPTRQPQLPRIDRANPINRGLVVSITPVGGVYRDIINGRSGTPAGTAPVAGISPKGRSLYSPTAAGRIDFSGAEYSQHTSSGYTHFVVVHDVAIGDGGCFWTVASGDSGDQSLYVARFGTALAVGHGNEGGPQSADGWYNTLADGKTHSLCVSGPGTTARRLELDGVTILDTTGTLSPANVSGPQLRLYANRGGSFEASGHFLLHDIWNRQLSPAESRSLHARWWQGLEGANRAIYVASSAAVSATTATAAAGAATVSAVGKSTAATSGTAAGAATVSGVGKSTAATSGTAAGVALVSGVGGTSSAGQTTATPAAGAATVSATAGALAKTDATTAAGAATVSGVGKSTASATATAAVGTAVVSAVGKATAGTTATPSAGSATVSGVGATSAAGQMTAAPASGLATVSATAGSVAMTTATAAAGVAEASGVGSFSTASSATTAIAAQGVVTVLGIGSSIAVTTAVPAAGSSIVLAYSDRPVLGAITSGRHQTYRDRPPNVQRGYL